MAALADPQQQLAWEARQRTGAGVAAILAGLLTLGSDLWSQSLFSGAPESGFLESLGQAVQEGPVGEEPSVRTGFFGFYDENATAILGSAVLRGIAFLLLAWAVTFLAAATRSRRAELVRPLVYLALIGAVLAGLSVVLGAVGSASAVSSFVGSGRTVDDAADVAGGTLLIASQLIGLVGPLLLALGIFFVSLNAMRAGLVPRFLGILGLITAVLIVVPLGPLPVVQAFWLIALGLVFLRLMPERFGGVPPAWRTGKAEPWPSSQEMAEARRRAAGAPEPEPAAAVPAGVEHPASKKRKRKRRG